MKRSMKFLCGAAGGPVPSWVISEFAVMDLSG
jgi:hypothetical protein